MSIRLLVSVRNGVEAVAAVRGGADIVDVKEPDHGSLGFAGANVISDVVGKVDGECAVSAALGECREWLTFEECVGTERRAISNAFGVGAKPKSNGVDTVGAMDSAFTELKYVKMGPAGLLDGDQPERWRESLSAAREQWEARLRRIATSSGTLPSWVAVAYADDQAASAPSANEILEAAIQSNCAGLLIDTFVKGNGSTLDLLSEDSLRHLQRTANEAGMFFALAGQITENHLSVVKRLKPDILAVRGAVCEENDRRATICPLRLAALQKALQQI